MLCPVCRFDNFEGEDSCANCGADLVTADLSSAIAEGDDAILRMPLDALGMDAPRFVEASAPVAEVIRQMHASGSDCLLVRDQGRLVGIFTDRDAAVKAVDKRLGLFKVGDFMTPDPVTLSRGDTLALAINKMAIGGFRALLLQATHPVVMAGFSTSLPTPSGP